MAEQKRKYRIVGLKYPGTVDLYPYDTVNLFDLSDDKLEEIKNKTGCKYIQPAIDAPAPKQEITTKTPPKKIDK